MVIGFSIYCIIALVGWKIQKNSDPILNSGSWIRCARYCVSTTGLTATFLTSQSRGRSNPSEPSVNPDRF